VVVSSAPKLDDLKQEINSRVGFTSEEFKIEINGLPRFFGVSDAKKLFARNELSYHKMKPCGKGATYMFVNFKNEEDREKAIAVLDGQKVKRGGKLKAFKAKAAKDPMLKAKDIEEDTRPVLEQIRSAVCPLSNLPYEEQLEKKSQEVEKILSEVRREIVDQYKFLKGFDKGGLATREPIVRSPVLQGYRNKCEFSVGHHPETDEVTVGFRLASYKKGSVAVVGVDDIPIVSDVMKAVVKSFESFVRTSGLKPLNNISQTGHWKQLTVRTSRNGDVMVWAILHPQDMSDEDKKDLREKFTDHFQNDQSVSVTSLHIQFFGRKEKGAPDPPIEHISGSPTIKERLFSLSFTVSPQAFFQVNTEAAEVLYKTAGDAARLNEKSTLIDVCCGTGTIGLCLADRCERVIGVELVEKAVEDAKENARANNVNNAEFQAGRAEFLLPDILRRCPDAVAIVDPPRAGLHPKAILALRSSAVQTLVFISCDAKAASKNFVALARPTSNAFPGDPFMPRRAIPVDLFPHSGHFELVILFERMPLKEMIDQEGDTGATEMETQG